MGVPYHLSWEFYIFKSSLGDIQLVIWKLLARCPQSFYPPVLPASPAQLNTAAFNRSLVSKIPGLLTSLTDGLSPILPTGKPYRTIPEKMMADFLQLLLLQLKVSVRAR